MKISVEVFVRSDINAIWCAWTTPNNIKQWNAASDTWHNPRSENGGVRVIETFDAEDESSAGQRRQGWHRILDNFALHVEEIDP